MAIINPVMKAVSFVSIWDPIRIACVNVWNTCQAVVVDLAFSHNPSTQLFFPTSMRRFWCVHIVARLCQDVPVLEHNLHANEQTKTCKEHKSEACARG